MSISRTLAGGGISNLVSFSTPPLSSLSHTSSIRLGGAGKPLELHILVKKFREIGAVTGFKVCTQHTDPKPCEIGGKTNQPTDQSNINPLILKKKRLRATVVTVTPLTPSDVARRPVDQSAGLVHPSQALIPSALTQMHSKANHTFSRLYINCTHQRRGTERWTVHAMRRTRTRRGSRCKQETFERAPKGQDGLHTAAGR